MEASVNVFKRHHFDVLLHRLGEPRRFLQVLAGPRQVGKSTLIDQMLAVTDIAHQLENADRVEENDTDWIRRVWESARARMVLERHDEFLLVIDEVQKIRNWSEAVKREWDADTHAGLNMKVVLLGSSRLLLRKGLKESLAGRFELIRMGHWTLEEMENAFGWSPDQYIYFGGYPGTASLVADERRWRHYVRDALVAPSIEKDVVMTSNIYKPALMKQLFELGCSYSAELLSLTKMVAQLQDAGNVTTLASYLGILNECSFLTGLQKYACDDARKYNSVPKFQVYNNALLTAYHGKSYETIRTNPELWGRWVESAVGAHLLSQADELGYDVLYWRSRHDEVDYILQAASRTVAIEVKSGRRGMNSGLVAFDKQFHPNRSIVVGTGGIPVDVFLRASVEALL